MVRNFELSIYIGETKFQMKNYTQSRGERMEFRNKEAKTKMAWTPTTSA